MNSIIEQADFINCPSQKRNIGKTEVYKTLERLLLAGILRKTQAVLRLIE